MYQYGHVEKVARSMELTTDDEDQEETARAPASRTVAVRRVLAASAAAAGVAGVLAIVDAAAKAAGGSRAVGPQRSGENVELQSASTLILAIDGKGCSNWDQILLETRTATDAKDCWAQCANNAQCTSSNFQTQKQCGSEGGLSPDTCYLFKGSCTMEDNACWTLSYPVPATPPYTPPVGTLTGTVAGKGCSNWDQMMLAQSIETSEDKCIEKCVQDPKCTACNFQVHPACGPDGGNTPGTCYLYDGTCLQEDNECWSLTTVSRTR